MCFLQELDKKITSHKLSVSGLLQYFYCFGKAPSQIDPRFFPLKPYAAPSVTLHVHRIQAALSILVPKLTESMQH